MEKQPYRILVAEDEAIARLALCRMCERSGCPVEIVAEAGTGSQIMSAAAKTQPHILLIDVVMPGIDGLEAARIVRERNPGTRVVIISAYEDFGFAQRALRLGAIDYLLKPVRPEQLTQLLKKLCADLDAEGDQAITAVSSQANHQDEQDLVRQGSEERIEKSPHAYLLKRAREYIISHYAQSLTLEQVAQHVSLSPAYLSRLFRQEMDSTFIEYLTQLRLEEAKRLLRTTTLSITEISYAVGYQSPNYLSALFRMVEGTTASLYRRNNSI